MELRFAKEFILGDLCNDLIYITKSYDKFLELLEKDEYLTPFAVVDTERGLEMFEIEKNYDGEYFIWQRFMHKDSFLKFHNDNKIISYE